MQKGIQGKCFQLAEFATWLGSARGVPQSHALCALSPAPKGRNGQSKNLSAKVSGGPGHGASQSRA